MLSYYKRFLPVFVKDFRRSTGEQVIGALLVFGILVCQIWFGVIRSGEIRANFWAIAWPYVLLIVGFFVWHLIRAPYTLDQERQNTEDRLNGEIADCRRWLEPKIEIGEPDHFAYTIASIVTHGYRIPIRNVSQAKTIKNVNVQLTNIQPKPPEYTWGSAMPLHWNHDNKPNAAPAVSKFSRTRDLQAGTPEQIDLVYASTYAEKIFIFHIAENIDQQILRPADKYRITIEAKGDDVPAATAMFDVCIDKDGLLQCVAVKPK